MAKVPWRKTLYKVYGKIPTRKRRKKKKSEQEQQIFRYAAEKLKIRTRTIAFPLRGGKAKKIRTRTIAFPLHGGKAIKKNQNKRNVFSATL